MDESAAPKFSARELSRRLVAQLEVWIDAKSALAREAQHLGPNSYSPKAEQARRRCSVARERLVDALADALERLREVAG